MPKTTEKVNPKKEVMAKKKKDTENNIVRDVEGRIVDKEGNVIG